MARLLPAESIYLGGGTPSRLTPEQLEAVIGTLRTHYMVRPDAEITIEMNPDDIARPTLPTPADMLHTAAAGHGNTAMSPLTQWFKENVNRVSLGVQTFNDRILRQLHRRHNAATAAEAVRILHEEGIENISIDLIYGLPGQTMEVWAHDLDMAFSLGIQHISAYALSYEPGTPLTRQRDAGLIREADDELSVAMYESLCRRAEAEGFCHYEISNFALPGYRSRHNSSYWTGHPYMGFGPGAHSYDGRFTRRANLPDLHRYLDYYAAAATMPTGKGDAHTDARPTRRASTCLDKPFDIEDLDTTALYDEAVMCGLRTSEGISLEATERRFGTQRLSYMMRMAEPHLAAGRLRLDDGRLRLTPSALMTSDGVMADLMAE